MLLNTSKARHARRARRARANDNDSLVPELWANETLMVLEENMVIGNLVHRDFSNDVAQYGDQVNTRRPTEFTAVRKSNSDTVTIQDAITTNIAVKLNQWAHTSFMIKDGEESKSFKELIPLYVQPAALSIARLVDRAIYGRVGAFLINCAGGLGSMTTSTARGYVLDARGKLNTNKAPMENRSMIVTTNSETTLLNLDLFTQAQQVGDRGEALRKASIGEKLGFDFFMAQNATSVATGSSSTVTGAINLAAGYVAGTTTFTVDGFSAAIPVNSWITIAGDMTPLRVVSTVGGATPTSITVKGGIRNAVADNAVVTVYKVLTTGAAYAAGYDGVILTTLGGNNQAKVGQFVTFGNTAPASGDEATNPIYSVVAVNGSTSITLDRPLDVAVGSGDAINLAPVGDYNFGFTKNAIALVSRPLAVPRAGTGALSSAINYNNIGMRVTITYNGEKQGHLVTMDLLFGTALLDLNCGVVMLG